MPLVFAENEATESGLSYEDETGVHYQFPKRYRNYIKPGVAFVYYRGRKKKRGRQLPVYFGTGYVGDVRQDPNDEVRLVCDILDYKEFVPPVPFKQGADAYLEPGGKRSGYYQPGVREIPADVFENILIAANLTHAGNEPVRDRGGVAQAVSVDRMVRTTVNTTAHSKGQIVTKTVKVKRLSVSTTDLAAHLLELIDRQEGRCAISGLRLQFDAKDADKELLCSLDRIDSSEHYTLENLQVVCRFVNRWKGADSDAEFRRLIRLIRASGAE